jgi:hypothetical protein
MSLVVGTIVGQCRTQKQRVWMFGKTTSSSERVVFAWGANRSPAEDDPVYCGLPTVA